MKTKKFMDITNVKKMVRSILQLPIMTYLVGMSMKFLKGKRKENLTIFGKPIKEEKKIFFIGKISIYQGRVLVAKFDIHTHKYVFYSYGKEIFLEKFKKEEQRHERF